MHLRGLAIATLICALIVAGCRTDVKETAPHQSDSGFSFEIDDGTGIFHSKTKSYLPVYCGTQYPVRKMDIGQENFDAIEGLVTAGNIWSAKVIAVPHCHAIDVDLPGQYYQFDLLDKSVTLNIGQCQRVDPAHEPYLRAMRQIVRAVSDRQKLVVKGECIRF
jgi:hypothetical protein